MILVDVGCTLDLGYIIDLGCELLHPHRALSPQWLSFLYLFIIYCLDRTHRYTEKKIIQHIIMILMN